MAFVGGTGILVFVDLLALLLRCNLGISDPIFKPSFKFVLYASFASREDALALELMEGLQYVSKCQKNNNFELHLRISNETNGNK